MEYIRTLVGGIYILYIFFYTQRYKIRTGGVEAALSAWAAEAGSSHGGYGGGKPQKIASKSKRKRVVVKGRTSRRRRRSYRNSRWRRV